jgi:diacylglycerol kinase family enzyme
MNAIFLYSNAPGSGRIVNKIDFIRRRLEDTFDHVNISYANNIDELDKLASLACAKYDVLIFAGGDGTFHASLTRLPKRKKADSRLYFERNAQ